MRQVTVTTPEGKGTRIAQIAFDAGISDVAIHPVRVLSAIVPVWFGVSFVFGFPPADPTPPKQRALGWLLNVAGILAASIAIYAVLRMKSSSLRVFQKQAGH